MVYRAIGLMSGSSLDGLDITFVEFTESAGKWNYEIKAAETIAYNNTWWQQLRDAIHLSAYQYLQLHSSYGKYIGEQVNAFINKYNLHHQVQLIASHGHTVFHSPPHFTAQLGDGAAIAAATGINVVSDLRAMDVALGGQGAPIVPLGEKLLFAGYDFLLNIGGIANLTCKSADAYFAFDICPANSILNKLTATIGKEYDEGGKMAKSGSLNIELLQQLNALDYFTLPHPKSLANQFGNEIIYPLIQSFSLPVNDALHTYTKHITAQISNSISSLPLPAQNAQLLVTGGGAFNTFLLESIQQQLSLLNIKIVLPSVAIIHYKEALIMALLGILRWREEDTVLASVTGALRSSIGGAVWIGQEA